MPKKVEGLKTSFILIMLLMSVYLVSEQENCLSTLRSKYL